jgi:hypothetical protein
MLLSAAVVVLGPCVGSAVALWTFVLGLCACAAVPPRAVLLDNLMSVCSPTSRVEPVCRPSRRAFLLRGT